ncbi:hypothetical protein CBS101457_005797 [Exobasidium rhododendri]|nr:hypothetical protein CBS101457_005797 [Exobasidium rhododendri]
MTRPTLGTSSSDLLLPAVAPFESEADVGVSLVGTGHHHQKQQQKPSTRSHWSLWPLKTSSTLLSNDKITPNSSSAQDSSQTKVNQIYVAGDSVLAPPIHYVPGQRSGSSPPTTPPDCLIPSPFERTAFSLGVAKAGTLPKQQPSSRATLIQSTSPSSRNDIFSSPVISPAPAPRLQTTGGRPSNSRNANIFDRAVSSPQQSIPARSGHQRVSSVESVSDRPGYGRSNTMERENERARIRQSNAEVEFRLCPNSNFLLGEGRHCTVYLGSYRTKGSGQFKTDGCRGEPDWTLCAIKRLHSDRESELLGLEEAFALRRLGPHPNIVKLINIRDEVALTTTPSTPAREGSDWSGVAVPTSSHSLEENSNRVDQGLSSTHGRSISESQADSAHDKMQSSLHLHRRLASSPAAGPVVVVASPDDDDDDSDDDGRDEDVFVSPTSPETTLSNILVSPTHKETATPVIPRLLILLELLPYSLSSFARRNPDRIDLAQWKQWALELAGVVEWLHAKGCVHADLKPENILLTSDLKIKLCDFNSALFPHPSTPLTDGLGLGTPAYGAPELASSRDFSYPIDIWSLGAMLYTLARGVDSFRTARSMIDILHRKRVFFESEENDRIASLSVAEGRPLSFIEGGTTTSRKGSLRGKSRVEGDYAVTASLSRPNTMLQRENSNGSVSSIASSVMLSGSSARNPSIRAIQMLLEPSPPSGVKTPTTSSSIHTSLFVGKGVGERKREESEMSGKVAPPSRNAGGSRHHRATSLGKIQSSDTLLSPDTARRPKQVSRPTVLRRTTSYGGVEINDTTTVEEVEKEDLSTSQASFSPEPLNEIIRDSASLRLAVTAAFAQSNLEQQQQLLHQQSQQKMKRRESSSGSVESKEMNYLYRRYSYEDEETRPYMDGSPALILPGGGRLPDEARNLLEKMLIADPDRRPTATQVRLQLEAL